MTKKLTPKQEGFCYSYIETGNASEAYRRNYNAENMSPEAIKVNACKLLKNTNVALTLKELQQHHQKRHDITVDSITEKYIKAEQFAYDQENPAAVVSSITALAKLHGLIKDKKESNITGTIIEVVDYSNARKNQDTL